MTENDTTDEVPHHEEIRQHFDQELDSIRQNTVLMGGLVLENARLASEAVVENRLDLVDKVMEADEVIDAQYAALEEEVFLVMATQQPVAGDLRFLVSSTRMLYELERTGNLVTNIADAFRRNEGFDLSPQLHSLLARLSRASCEILERGLDTLADLDTEAGERLEQEDDEIDELVGDLYAGLAHEADLHGVDTAIQLSRVGRYFERIADHTVNIGQHVCYIVTGSFPGQRKAAD